jgi:hypothetical protein
MTQLRMITGSVLLGLTLSACSRPEPGSKADSQHQTPSEVVGKLAYKANKAAEKAATATGREIRKSAVEAHKGYKEAQRQDREKVKDK